MSQSRDGEALDRNVLNELRELGPEVVRTVAESFFEDTPTRLVELRALSARGDDQSFQRVAHTLQGSCGAIGATRMMHICGELQKQLRNEQASELLAELESEYDEVSALLKQEVDTA